MDKLFTGIIPQQGLHSNLKKTSFVPSINGMGNSSSTSSGSFEASSTVTSLDPLTTATTSCSGSLGQVTFEASTQGVNSFGGIRVQGNVGLERL